MTKYQTTVAVPASGVSNNVRLSSTLIAAYATVFSVANGYSATNFPCARVFIQMATGTTGVGFVGDNLVNQVGANGAVQLQPSTSATVPGSSFSYETKFDMNNINLADFYLHGTVPNDVIIVWVTIA